MFTDSALAARIDRSEARLCAEMAGRTDTHLVLPISGGQAVYAGPRAPMNKLIGLGFDQPLDLAALAAIEEEWRRRQEPVRVELSNLTDPQIPLALSGRGYQLHGFENVLGHSLDRESATPIAPQISVEVVGPEDNAVWARLASEAFANMDGTGSAIDEQFTQEQIDEALRDYAVGPDFTRYLARYDGEPVGEAAMRIDDRLAQLAGSGTAPAFRGRGVQKALVERRLDDARRAGCDLAVVVTAPGTRSQANVMRRGFALLYTRAVLIRSWS